MWIENQSAAGPEIRGRFAIDGAYPVLASFRPTDVNPPTPQEIML
jgi:hypothetical protein